MAGPANPSSLPHSRECVELPETLKSSRSTKGNHQSIKKEEYQHDRPRASRCLCETRLPPVPKRGDPAPISYPPAHDDYVQYNAKHVADIANYHDPKMQIIDSKDGHVMNLDKSGLMPQFVNKPTFGRIPAYLKKGQHQQQEVVAREGSPTKTRASKKDRPSFRPSANKEIEMLQQRWIELEKLLGSISFSRPDKRELLEDELRSIEQRLRMAADA